MARFFQYQRFFTIFLETMNQYFIFRKKSWQNFLVGFDIFLVFTDSDPKNISRYGRMFIPL